MKKLLYPLVCSAHGTMDGRGKDRWLAALAPGRFPVPPAVGYRTPGGTTTGWLHFFLVLLDSSPTSHVFFPFVFFLSCVKNFCLFSVCNSAFHILFIGGSYGNETYLDGVRVYLRNLRRSYPPFLTDSSIRRRLVSLRLTCCVLLCSIKNNPAV